MSSVGAGHAVGRQRSSASTAGGVATAETGRQYDVPGVAGLARRSAGAREAVRRADRANALVVIGVGRASRNARAVVEKFRGGAREALSGSSSAAGVAGSIAPAEPS